MKAHPDKDSCYLAFGKVVKPHGLKGEIKVVPFSGVVSDVQIYAEIFLGYDSAEKKYTVKQCRAQGKFAILNLLDVNDRSSSELLVGQKIWVIKESLPELSTDEFYWHEMEGIEVVTDSGQRLGTVSSIMRTGAKDVLVVDGSGKEYLIPVVDEIIVSMDSANRVLTIAPFPGLLEINESDAL